MVTRKRCAWAERSDLMRAYHDDEWGKPSHDDTHLFEILDRVLPAEVNVMLLPVMLEVAPVILPEAPVAANVTLLLAIFQLT